MPGESSTRVWIWSLLSRLPVNSSHGQLVTGQLVTDTSHHTVNSSQASITKPPVPVVIIYTPSASGDIQKQCSTRTAYNYRYLCYFNVYCRFQITATDYTSTKSTVNSSRRRETRRSTRHTILRCGELTVWRVDWFPLSTISHNGLEHRMCLYDRPFAHGRPYD